mmetsp:Transcript_21532/g.54300  ORF Transcript_21532/g.54300 Transcript_21532/m.54300 type:complete len:213 (+) Transcript_21532:412-1050(+)
MVRAHAPCPAAPGLPLVVVFRLCRAQERGRHRQQECDADRTLRGQPHDPSGDHHPMLLARQEALGQQALPQRYHRKCRVRDALRPHMRPGRPVHAPARAALPRGLLLVSPPCHGRVGHQHHVVLPRIPQHLLRVPCQVQSARQRRHHPHLRRGGHCRRYQCCRVGRQDARGPHRLQHHHGRRGDLLRGVLRGGSLPAVAPGKGQAQEREPVD